MGGRSTPRSSRDPHTVPPSPPLHAHGRGWVALRDRLGRKEKEEAREKVMQQIIDYPE